MPRVKAAAHIASDATVADFLNSLESQNADALVVSDDGSSVDGIISEHDVVRGLRVFGSDVLRKPVRDLRTAKVITCAPSDRVEAIVAIMVSKHVRHLPVVANDKLVGIVSIRDLLRLHLETVSAEAEAMRGYIQDH